MGQYDGTVDSEEVGEERKDGRLFGVAEGTIVNARRGLKDGF